MDDCNTKFPRWQSQSAWPFYLQRRSHWKCSSLHTSCACVFQWGGPSKPMVRSIHKEESHIPFALTGEQLYKLRFGQYLWTFNRCPPESSHYRISGKLPLWYSSNEDSLLLTIKLLWLQITNKTFFWTCDVDIQKPGCCLPPTGHTLPVLLVRQPKDPSKHSEVVLSFWVTVGSSCSKLDFWL